MKPNLLKVLGDKGCLELYCDSYRQNCDCAGWSEGTSSLQVRVPQFVSSPHDTTERSLGGQTMIQSPLCVTVLDTQECLTSLPIYRVKAGWLNTDHVSLLLSLCWCRKPLYWSLWSLGACSGNEVKPRIRFGLLLDCSTLLFLPIHTKQVWTLKTNFFIKCNIYFTGNIFKNKERT